MDLKRYRKPSRLSGRRLLKKGAACALAALTAAQALPASLGVEAACEQSREEAVRWLEEKVETGWAVDYDGAFGVQCVDLVAAYYDYLAGFHTVGNANDYLSNELPEGWIRTYAGPETGDIIVWDSGVYIGAGSSTASADPTYGHIGIIVSVNDDDTLTTVECNVSGNPEAVYQLRNNYSAGCYIHPDFTQQQNAKEPLFTITPGDSAVPTLFQWNDEDSLSWNLHLYREEDGEYTSHLELAGLQETSYSIPLEIGSYQAWMDCEYPDYTASSSPLFFEINEHEHVWTKESETPASCNQEGTSVYVCKTCLETYDESLPAAEHQWSEVQFFWSEYCSECTASRSCLICAKIETADASVSEIENGTVLEARAVFGGQAYTDRTDKPVKDTFQDVSPDVWYFDTVYEAYEKKLMTGLDVTHFGPNVSMSKAMAVTVLYRIAGSPETAGESSYQDVNSGLWYSKPVAWAQETGLLEGFIDDGGGNFGVDTEISREQLCVLIYRYLESAGADTSLREPLDSFKDKDEVSQEAADAIEYCLAADIIDGAEDKTMLYPLAKASRAENAKILLNTDSLN